MKRRPVLHPSSLLPHPFLLPEILANVLLNGQPHRPLIGILAVFQAQSPGTDSSLVVGLVVGRAKEEIPEWSGQRTVAVINEERLIPGVGDHLCETIHRLLVERFR